MAKKPEIDERTLQTMAALVGTPPKPHGEMKVGKPRAKRAKSPQKKAPRRYHSIIP